ncbi:MAG TPA: NADH dehydrogenase FAD-containing subunit [Micrococcales bacterium]|uniref:NAD(P)/FAD-dependent oxidoreductase n=1 Tax=Miniimonas arenae TaxID=676201 RepID=A0A5C5BE78_9MICO|nr:NAD(P)/FAD-dependent oxidoreductase [Miniimonas arenae]TNU74764.1 NAD(P)/FAD-dependent oxidoreductase [Miniimonas arenae]HCX84398.1 NADH dehydrogenase FAD-containing subunit [Micrococcales bacterium]
MTSSTAPTARAAARRTPRILILGGGYVGLYTAIRLRKQLGRKDAAIVVVDPRSYMTYQPFLPEAAAGSIEPRHVVASHRRELRGSTVINGRVTAIQHGKRAVQVTPSVGEAYWVRYDHLVVSLGSVARTLPIPGLAEVGMGFKQVEEAFALRNQVLGLLDEASSVWDPEVRKRMLTFTFVGGGFAGIEALGEIEDMARSATKDFDSIDRDDLRFVLIEATPRILPELGEELGGYALEQLRGRGIELKLSTFLNSCVDGHVVLSTGEEYDCDTIVWTAGVKANPVLQQSDLPLDKMGRVTCDAHLRVVDEEGNVVEGAWAAGDCAAVPDLAKGDGAFCAPTAQHAVRQSKHLGDNIVRDIAGQETTPYVHANLGTVASLGLGKGVAQIFGVKLRGPLAWFMHRTYHLWAMPTLERKVRIVLDWTTALLFRREPVALGGVQTPRAEFVAAAAPAPSRDDVPQPPELSVTH